MPQAYAYADVIFGNEFYSHNRDKTEYLDGWSWRQYVINSPTGYVFPETEPGSGFGVLTGRGYQGMWSGYRTMIVKSIGGMYMFDNGDVITIEAVYSHNGRYWGITRPNHMYQPSGWILMEEILVIYHSIDFFLEYFDTFYAYDGIYSSLLAANQLVVWQWPGSDREKYIIDDKENINSIATNVFYVYEDATGREWGCVGSYSWICLSDPANSNIPAFFPAPEPAKWVPGGEGAYKWSFVNNNQPTETTTAASKDTAPSINSHASADTATRGNTGFQTKDGGFNPLWLLLAAGTLVVLLLAVGYLGKRRY